MTAEIAVAFRLAKGYRLRPWQSPYLRWRVETWSGLHADTITAAVFVSFVWQHRTDLWRYLGWAAVNVAETQ
jgi:hypothetical protein